MGLPPLPVVLSAASCCLLLVVIRQFLGCPLVRWLIPAPGLNACPACNKPLQAPEEPIVRSVLVQNGVPKAAHDAVVPLKRGAVMCAMRFPGDKQAHVLEGNNVAGQLRLLHVAPGVELLAHACQEDKCGCPHVPDGRSAVAAQSKEERGDKRRPEHEMHVVAKLSLRDGPRAHMMALLESELGVLVSAKGTNNKLLCNTNQDGERAEGSYLEGNQQLHEAHQVVLPGMQQSASRPEEFPHYRSCRPTNGKRLFRSLRRQFMSGNNSQHQQQSQKMLSLQSISGRSRQGVKLLKR